MAVSPLLEHSDSYLIDSRLSKDTGLASRQKAHEAKAAPFRLRLFSFVQHGSVLRRAVWGRGQPLAGPYDRYANPARSATINWR